MALSSGSKLGHYEILSQLGAGGMGEVYRARDPRIGREVAVKVLPSSYNGDPNRLRRFEQEARAAGALNHPNIMSVYDVGSTDGSPYLVSELLEGETLREKMRSGALPQRKSIEYALQIAHGLSAAHEKGIIHRDLKPENLFVTRDGRVKILDFGLAKLIQPDEDASRLTEAPTVSHQTEPGAVMGTIAYMSPEQARGKTADHRSDIFALGVILYEMLTGKFAFRHETAADTVSAILHRDPPDLSATVPDVSPGLERIVRHCLEKNAEERFDTTRDLAFALEAISGTSGLGARAEAASQTSDSARSKIAYLWPVITIFFIAVSGILAFLYFQPKPPSASEVSATWLEISPPHQRFPFWPAPSISPDGQQIAFWATDETGKFNLWIRSLDSPVARIIPGTTTENEYLAGFPPFWSPDGRSLGFFADSKLKRIDLAGGTPLTLADAPVARGGSWSTTGVIIFVPAPGKQVYRISASGGEATPLPLSLSIPLYPHFLPDGQHFFVNSLASGVYIASLDAKEARQLSKVESQMEFASGYVFFGQHGNLFAQPFDEHQLALSGEPFRIAENLGFSCGASEDYAFSVSAQGNLVYWSGTWLPVTQLTWFSRDGQRLGTMGDPGEYMGFALSPSGRQAILERHDPQTNLQELWLMDNTTGIASKFTSGPDLFSGTAVWAPAGDRVLFATFPGGLSSQSLQGGEAKRLLNDFILAVMDISPDGHTALFGKEDPETGQDLWLLPLSGDKKPKPYLMTKQNERNGRFSPDGHWIAYQSDESGSLEVYVQSFPEIGRQVRVSNNGGQRPEWRKDGKELYYIAPDHNLMAAAVNGSGPLFQSAAPKPLFSVSTGLSSSRQQYQASADGSRFLVNSRLEVAGPRTLTVVLNWKTLVKR